MKSTRRTESADGLLIQAESARAEVIDRPADIVERVAALAARCEAVGAWDAAAVASTAEAWAHRELYRHDAADLAIERAIRCAERCASPRLRSDALVVRAMIHLERGAPGAARNDLAAARAAGGTDAAMLFAASVIADHAGLLAEARSLLGVVLDDPACPDDVRLKALNNLGSMLAESEPDRAIAVLEAGAVLAEQQSEHLAAIIEHNIGSAHAFAGRVPDALASFDEAERRLGLLGGPVVEHLLEVARLLGRLGLLPEARATATRALDGLDVAGGELVRADALLTAGRLARLDGDRDAAADLLARARDLFAEQQRQHGAALVLLETAAMADGGGQQVSVDELAASADLLAELGHVRACADAHIAAGRIALESGDAARARRHFVHDAIAAREVDPMVRDLAAALAARASGDRRGTLAAVRVALVGLDRWASLADAPDLRVRLATPRAELEQLQRWALATRRPADQLDSILRSRPPAPIRPQALPSLPSADRAAWRGLQRRLGDDELPLDARIAVHQRLHVLERRLRAQRWSTVGEPMRVAGDRDAPEGRPQGVAGLRTQLAGRVAVGVVRVGESAVAYCIGGEDDGAGLPQVSSRRLGSWSDITAAADQLRRTLAMVARQGDGCGPGIEAAARSAADRLDDLVALPVVELAAAETAPRSILFIVDDGLHSTPWCAVPSWWTVPVGIAPLSVTGRPRQRRARPGIGLLAGPDLAAAADEVERLAAMWRATPCDVRVDHDATASAVLEALESSDVVHVAAHADVRPGYPEAAALRLADGPLTFAEILDARRLPRTIVLAACSIGGDPAGVVSLLLGEGASEVVAATIPFDDGIAVDVSIAVHRSIVGGGAAADGLADARRVAGSELSARRWAALGGVSAFESFA